jgi:hypothetical protein
MLRFCFCVWTGIGSASPYVTQVRQVRNPSDPLGIFAKTGGAGRGRCVQFTVAEGRFAIEWGNLRACPNIVLVGCHDDNS